MSRPRVWTGSKWQDLRFCYEPGLFPTWRYPWVEHIQDTPAVYNFTSTNEGWQSNPRIVGNLFGWGPAAWSGQAISVVNTSTNIALAQAGLRSTTFSSLTPWVGGQRLAGRYTFSVARGSANHPVTLYINRPGTTTDSETLNFGTSDVSQQTHTTGSSFTTPPTGQQGNSVSLNITISTSFPPTGATPHLTLHSASVIDLNTGQPAIRVVQQGRDEAKAWNGSSWV